MSTTLSHTHSNYNMWSVQFTLTIITYVLYFLYIQQKLYNYNLTLFVYYSVLIVNTTCFVILK